MDVMFYEAFEEEQDAIRRHLPAHITAEFTSQTIQEKGDGAAPCPLVSIRTQSQIPASWGRETKGILTRSTGYDHLAAFREQTKTKSALGYLPDYCSRAVAEQAILMMMALLRKLPRQIKQFADFERGHLTGAQCQGRKLLVVGVGRIGLEVVNVAKGLGMDVKGVDIERKSATVDYVALKDGIRWAQCLVVALPLTEQTRGLLSYDRLIKAGPGLVLVNVGRGESTPLVGLKRLLDEEILAGLGLDVYENESGLANVLRTGKHGDEAQMEVVRALQKKDNVIFTPHNAFNTEEALERKAERSARAVAQFLHDGSFPDGVPS